MSKVKSADAIENVTSVMPGGPILTLAPLLLVPIPYTGRPIGADTCNALITDAPLTVPELNLLREHFATLERLCVISGPRFGPPRQIAVDFHNRAVRRLKGIKEDARRRAIEEEENLMEIG